MEQKERQSCQKYSKSHLPMPRVSVIVPVYNSELYLNQCVDSILAQTYSDYEVLLIDDGSTDQSSRVCDEYASKISQPPIKTTTIIIDIMRSFISLSPLQKVYCYP